MKASTAIICLTAAVFIFCSVTVQAKAVQQTSNNVEANSVNGDHERYQRDLKGIMETVSNSLKDVFTPNKETGKSKITTAAEDLMKMVGSMFGKQRK